MAELFPSLETLLTRYKDQESSLEKELEELQTRWRNIMDKYENIPTVKLGFITLPDLSFIPDSDQEELDSNYDEQSKIIEKLANIREKIDILTRIEENTDEKGRRTDNLWWFGNEQIANRHDINELARRGTKKRWFRDWAFGRL